MTDDEGKFSDEFYERWEHLIADVEIKLIPMRMLREIVVNMDDETEVVFDVSELLLDGASIEEIETAVQEFCSEHDENVTGIDFKINIENLAEEVERKTGRLLK